MADLLLTLRAPGARMRLAVCVAPALSREAARRHRLSEGSAAALAQGLCGALLLAATDRPDQPASARVDVQLSLPGPLKGLLVDADGSGAVRGLVRVNLLDRSGARTDAPGPGAPGPPHAPAGALHRFDGGPLFGGGADAVGGMLSVLRSAPGADALQRATVPFSGADLAAGLSAYLRADRALAGQLAAEVLWREREPLAAVAAAMVLPVREEDGDEAREVGFALRGGALAGALGEVERSAPANAHALAQRLAVDLGLGQLRMEGELRPRFSCRCSRERVVRALRTLGAAELRAMAAEDGGASATCDFCMRGYRIEAAELLELAGGGDVRS